MDWIHLWLITFLFGCLMRVPDYVVRCNWTDSSANDSKRPVKDADIQRAVEPGNVFPRIIS